MASFLLSGAADEFGGEIQQEHKRVGRGCRDVCPESLPQLFESDLDIGDALGAAFRILA